MKRLQCEECRLVFAPSINWHRRWIKVSGLDLWLAVNRSKKWKKELPNIILSRSSFAREKCKFQRKINMMRIIGILRKYGQIYVQWTQITYKMQIQIQIIHKKKVQPLQEGKEHILFTIKWASLPFIVVQPSDEAKQSLLHLDPHEGTSMQNLPPSELWVEVVLSINAAKQYCYWYTLTNVELMHKKYKEYEQEVHLPVVAEQSMLPLHIKLQLGIVQNPSLDGSY